MLLILVLAPFLVAAIALLMRSESQRPWTLPICGVVHLLVTIALLARGTSRSPFEWVELDPPGRLVLLVVSVLFFVCSIYAIGYLRERADCGNRVFCACLLVFLGMMSLMILAHHLGLMWVALEAMTLATGPLLYFDRSTRALEATWKYLTVGSVGVALALLGSLFLGFAALQGGHESSLLFADLLAHADALDKAWLRAAFILLFVGYGTKMGLAPMHTWKPDAYGEAPGIVGSLLAGGAASCAFLAILRVYPIVCAAGESALANRILLGMGLFSMAIGGVFMIRQRDFKRLLAYSSVEHMGILALGLSLGLRGAFGAMLHLVFNALVKGVMFLTAGNVHRSYGSKSTAEVFGALRRIPYSGALLVAAFLAITGSPPFAPFVSEFTILNAAVASDHVGIAVAMLAFLLIAFIGMGGTVLAVTQGRPPEAHALPRSNYRERLSTIVPPLVLLALALLLGLYVPPFLRELASDAAIFVTRSAEAPR